MALILSLGCRNALANGQGFYEMFNGGLLGIYTGPSPGVEYGVTGTEIVSMTAGFTSAGSGILNVSLANIIANSGSAGYFRLSSLDDTPTANADGTAIRAEGTCADLSGAAAEFTFSDLNMTAGKIISVIGTFQIPTE